MALKKSELFADQLEIWNPGGLPPGRALVEVTPQVTTDVTPEVRILTVRRGAMRRQALQTALGLKDDGHFRKAYLLPALEAGLIEMTNPDKPTSRLQRYRLTAKGVALLRGHADGVLGHTDF